MSFFDFFFPEEAQAMHLRKIVASSQTEALRLQQQRMAEVRAKRAHASRTKSLENRVDELEAELGQVALLLEAVLELSEERGGLDRMAVAERVRQIDARDGETDGRVTPESEQAKAPFSSNRKWSEES